MGFRFRRSVRVLPGVRLNLSRGGASVSLGGRGFHYTVGPKGTRTTVGIPGTGLSWSQYTPHGGGSSSSVPSQASPVAYLSPQEPRIPYTVPNTAEQPILNAIESKAGTEISVFSTSQLAPILNSAYRRFRFAPLTLIVSICLFIVSSTSELEVLNGLSALYATVFIPIAIFLDRYRRSVKVGIELNRTAETISAALDKSFSELKGCYAIWSVRAEAATADWKRNAGATKLNQRDKIRLKAARPKCIRGKAAFPSMILGNAKMFFLPDAVLVVSKNSVAALHYRDLVFSCSTIRYIEESRVPSDAIVVGQTWRFVNKSGGPDRRFNSNRQLPICQYGEMDFQSSGGLNGKIQFSNASAGQRFAKAIAILIKYAASDSQLSPFTSYAEAKRWPSVIFLCCAVAMAVTLGSVGVLTSPRILFAVSSAPLQPANKSSGPNIIQDNSATHSGDRNQISERAARGGNSSAMPPLNISPSLPSPPAGYPPVQSYLQNSHPFGGRY